MGTKAVRFSEKEEKVINAFLEENPFFDFSTLARVAILNFIENPELKLKPINQTNFEINKAYKTRIH